VGSTFSIQIPLQIVEEKAKWSAGLNKKVRAIVVQSSEDLLNNTSLALRSLGAEVRATPSLEQALAWLRADEPTDILFIDEKLRDEKNSLHSGLSWIRDHRYKFSQKTYVVLCISILDAQKSIQASPSSGVDQCLFHPLKPSELLEAMGTKHSSLTPKAPELADEAGINRSAHDSVLVVDDSTDNQTIMNIYLKALFNRIEFAGNGKEALEALERRRPNLVFMDIQMPIMDGFTAIAAIRAGEKGKSPLPVIALTAFTDEAEKQSCLRAGFTSHLAKPVSKKAINEVVRAILGGAKPPQETRAMQDSFDSLLADLVPEYLSKRGEEAKNLLKRLEEKKFEQISQAGHKLRGNGTTYGFPKLSALGAEIEKWAKEENVLQLEHTLRELVAFIESAQSKLKHSSKD
jgi:CheY-like chemotaxis protein